MKEMNKDFLYAYCRFYLGMKRQIDKQKLGNGDVNRYLCKVTGKKYTGDTYFEMESTVMAYLRQYTVFFQDFPDYEKTNKWFLCTGRDVDDGLKRMARIVPSVSQEMEAALYLYCRAVEEFYDDHYANESPRFCVDAIDQFLRDFTECNTDIKWVCRKYVNDYYTGQICNAPTGEQELMIAINKIKAELPRHREALELKDYRMDASIDDIMNTLFA